MRRRLLVLALLTTAGLLAALVVPLLVAYAEGRAEALHQERLSAATRFATLAAADDPDVLAPDLARYRDVTGVQAWLVGTDRSLLASSGTPLPDGALVDAALRAALDGVPSAPPPAVWPWRTDPLVVATPVGRDAQVLGAVLLVEGTDRVRTEVARRIAAAAAGSLVLLGLLGWLVASPLVGWIARPLSDLEDQVRQVGEGRPARARIEGPPELRRLAESFNTMSAQVERSQQQQRDLVADVSHQLANPLTALRLRLESLSADRPADVGPVLAETDRMARILDGLVEVSRTGAADREPVAQDVTARVRDRVQLWEPLFGGRLVLALPDVPVPAVLERDLVETVVDALLDNAAKYAPDAVVEVSLQPSGAGCVLAVRDHGPGVTPAEAAELGRRFHRLARHADVDGTGLGLAIVAGRVTDAGGTTTVEAAHPGLRVAVSLPGGPGPGTSAAPPGAAVPAG
ncbi:sensor histidine kinase [Klenkia taihuensis]|uniref:histidine kinase n=1 Tax=Klenkia taihuensis TaxID=1225127 RepID=A0A1I1R5R4_9ACTN|nr:HAMP domain-containing sensor histidine kinase [Klenkia taihuensis]GHE07457.1 two-component sensor histidine kinase [Klenkia taihuensis]SFD25640.1 Signal transduction histidine kinase [Klenkia taihuensis]